MDPPTPPSEGVVSPKSGSKSINSTDFFVFEDIFNEKSITMVVFAETSLESLL